MGSIKQINLKNRWFLFFSDIINIKNFDSDLLSISKISVVSTNDVICSIKYVTRVGTDSEKSLCLIFNNNLDRYIEEESNG